MSIFDDFPYSNQHTLNLDWILQKLKELEEYIKEYTAVNRVTIGGVWDIRKAYPQWSVVTDGNKTYMSQKPVPAGVAIDNTEYWLLLADLDPRINEIIVEIDKLKNEVVSVKNYGAIGDGVADDSDAISRAVLENPNKTVFFPAGVYLISRTILLPDYTTITGTGSDCVIRRANGFNGDMLQSVNYTKDSGTDNHDCTMHRIAISNMAIDGNKTGAASGNGISIYCGGIRFDTVWIFDQPDNGLNTEYNSYTNWINILGAEGYFHNVRIKNCGKTGWSFKGPHDSIISDCIIGTNGQSQNNTYDNMVVGQFGSAKIVNCHFYCDYGEVKPRYSLNIADKAYAVNVSNCHIEGAYTPLCVSSDLNVFNNCFIYASFGSFDAIVAAKNTSFTNCVFQSPATDPVPAGRPEFVCALSLDSKCTQINVDSTFAGCKATANENGFTHSVFKIRGYNESGAMDFAGNNPADSSCIIDIRGYFGSQSLYSFKSMLAGCTGDFSGRYANFGDIAMTGDVNTYYEHTFVSGYTAGTLNLPIVENGNVVYVHNNADVKVPVSGQGGRQINFVDKAYVPAHSTATFLAIAGYWRSSEVVYTA